MKMAVAVLLLSATDALLTLELIKLGAREVNVFMLGLIHGDLSHFVGVKMALTGLGVTYLVLRSSATVFGRIPVFRVLQGILAAYGVLVVYELGMLYYALSF
jgi:hypothetical protein